MLGIITLLLLLYIQALHALESLWLLSPIDYQICQFLFKMSANHSSYSHCYCLCSPITISCLVTPILPWHRLLSITSLNPAPIPSAGRVISLKHRLATSQVSSGVTHLLQNKVGTCYNSFSLMFWSPKTFSLRRPYGPFTLACPALLICLCSYLSFSYLGTLKTLYLTP